MSQQELFDYVMNTPHNTNPAILKQMIDANSSGGGVTSWNDLEDRPFGEVTEYAELLHEARVFETPIGYVFNAVLDFDAVIGEEYTVTIDGNEYTAVAEVRDDGNTYIGDYGTDGAECSFSIKVKGGMSMIEGEGAKDGSIVSISGLRKETKQLDEKFIPDTIARVKDIPEGFGGSWNDLADKPFSATYSDTLTWDGDVYGLNCKEYGGHKVSDCIPTMDEMLNGGKFTICANGDTIEVAITEDNITSYDGGYWIGSTSDTDDFMFNEYGDFIIVEYGNPRYEYNGIYFYRALKNDVYVSSLTIPNYQFETVNSINSKWLPEPLRTGERVVDLETLFEGDLDFSSEYYVEFPYSIDIEPGAIYLVTINGRKYECTTETIYNGVVVVGNGRLVQDSWIKNYTGEPFGFTSTELVLDRGLKAEERGVNSITIQKKNTIINTIDAKYIPDTIARMTDVPDHSWNTLKDKPFSLEKVNNVYWNGDIVGKMSITHEGKTYYKIADMISATDYYLLGATYTLNVNGTEQEITISDDDVYNNKIWTDFGRIIKDFYIVDFHSTLPRGLYAYYKNDDDQHIRVSRITTAGDYFWKFHTLNSAYLPKATAVADAAGETVTGAEFNALLTALRKAGYLE